MSSNLTNLSDEISWQDELTKSAIRYHIAGACVAVVFNILFGITDYINVREHFGAFMVFRICVSVVTGIALLLRRPLKLNPDFLIFIPFLLISIQNAYMWSFMDAEHMQKHTLAYIALFIGAGMLILWKIHWSIFVVLLSVIANIIYLSLNSALSVEDIMVSGGLLTATVMIFSIILIQTRYNLTKKEIIARLSLERSKKIIESKNADITASLRYAKKIQDAILPAETEIRAHFPDSFVYYKPRDIVSGDFYWFHHEGGKSYIAAVDCTGHGVPGAFMSMIGNTLLNKYIAKFKKPSHILNGMRDEVTNTLDSNQSGIQSDGMDMALCVIDHSKNKLQYAGAYNPVYIYRKGSLLELKADRMPIGQYFGTTRPFTNHSIKLEPGDAIYIFSDGYQDQIGAAGKKFSSLRLKNFFLEIHTKEMIDQRTLLESEMEKWKGNEDQLDDMLIIGIKY